MVVVAWASRMQESATAAPNSTKLHPALSPPLLPVLSEDSVH
jgi:hypothetical protein